MWFCKKKIKIKITDIEDVRECETCGCLVSKYSMGAFIGKKVIRKRHWRSRNPQKFYIYTPVYCGRCKPVNT
jgi:hypothetical protein